MANTEMKIVCFGDSLTYGYGVLEHIAYPYYLSKELPKAYPQYSWEIRNSGINGHTTREALARLQGSVLQHKPQMVFIWFGSNDSALNEGQYRTPYEFEENLRQIITQILSLSTGSSFHNGVPLIVLMTPPSMVDTDFYPFTTNDRLEYYGEMVKKLAAEYNLPVMDLFSVYTSIKNKADYEACFQYDGEHLSNRGYEVLYDELMKTIHEIMEKYA